MQLRSLVFDSDDRIQPRKLRSRIKENFTVRDLEILYEICLSNRFADNNEKVDHINYMLIPRGFMELGAGTNRYAMLKDNYVFKFSLDHYGFDDNETEFKMSKQLLDYGATKTYETNGLIAVAQYVNVMSKVEFHANKEKIREILKWMSRKYLFADLGCIDKNFRNWGWDDKHELRFIDYGYVFLRDENLLRCTHCQHTIGYDYDYDQMLCSHCGRVFRIHDIKTLMETDDETRSRMFEKKEQVEVSFAEGYDWNAESEKDSVPMLRINKSKEVG